MPPASPQPGTSNASLVPQGTATPAMGEVEMEWAVEFLKLHLGDVGEKIKGKY